MHVRLINKYTGGISYAKICSCIYDFYFISDYQEQADLGEFLILIGTFKVNFMVATIASLGVILGAAYMLWLYRKVYFY